MNVYVTEDEQLQQIKQWFKNYGFSLILGIVIALIATFGWRYWQQHQMLQAEQASNIYEHLLLSQSNQQTAQMNQAAADLMQHYSRTPYASYAGLLLAKAAVNANNLTNAEQNLQWVIAHASIAELQNIAKLRLARVLLAEKKVDDALKLLQSINNDNFAPAVDIIRGDAYTALGNIAEAKMAYQNALNVLPPDVSIRSLVQMKLDNLS